MIHFKCSKCGEGLEAPESLVGENITCPKCNNSPQVPTRLLGKTSLLGTPEISKFESNRLTSAPKNQVESPVGSYILTSLITLIGIGVLVSAGQYYYSYWLDNMYEKQLAVMEASAENTRALIGVLMILVGWLSILLIRLNQNIKRLQQTLDKSM